jgi:hypothetical protein
MKDKAVGNVAIQITESSTGKFWGSVTVEMEGCSQAWMDKVLGDNELDTVEAAVERIKWAASRHKPGRKPNGYRALINLARP